MSKMVLPDVQVGAFVCSCLGKAWNLAMVGETVIACSWCFGSLGVIALGEVDAMHNVVFS